ncbi:TetR family transcriptional regulator [Mycolicibacterium arenosum]|uniref:TetR family transcriptional regulator n=1 Tax=Mycolicibacterium arenosum TaxID=2952157 RepID=A0ABT1LYE8_9MYCO|nr:TetR family transcriptional regulator [Mycolicibacterium sp. CAU 1645]MCP9271232.1 TetR family transcriptional regulator [Mycolicibacterium sp. CAU 1645]
MATIGSIKAERFAEVGRKREIILDCAAEIASSGGYDAVKMRNVADAAGIAVGTLYRVFPSKSHVLVAVLTREFERIGNERDWGDTAGSSRLRVTRLNTRLLEECHTRPALTEAVTRAFVFADGSASAEVDRAEAVIEQLIGRAIAGGEPNPSHHRLAGIVSNIWLASLIAWVRHGVSAGDVSIRLERSIALIFGGEE